MKNDPQIKAQVSEILALVKKAFPGKLVELRIPGYGAIQCVAGGNHKRGTPPNTVEMSGAVLIKLCSDPNLWADLVASGQIQASGVASDLSQVFAQLSQHYPRR
jgi:Bacterial SCP ortholog